MSNFQKKKERERVVRKKILARRARKHLEEKEDAKLEQRFGPEKEKLVPIRNNKRDLEIRNKLKENAKILAGLQKEYEQSGVEVAQLLPEEISIAGEKPTLTEIATSHLRTMQGKCEIIENIKK